jgi:hypothetical protein
MALRPHSLEAEEKNRTPLRKTTHETAWPSKTQLTLRNPFEVAPYRRGRRRVDRRRPGNRLAAGHPLDEAALDDRVSEHPGLPSQWGETQLEMHSCTHSREHVSDA